MKHTIHIVLILAGTVVIMAPPLVNHLHAQGLMKALTAAESNQSVYVKEPITPTYSLGCWSIGALMIGAGTYFAVSNRERRTAGVAATSFST